VALFSQTMLKQSRHLLPNLLDISDLKNDELDCGLLGHHPQQESWEQYQ
jgi:hypothetical protein